MEIIELIDTYGLVIVICGIISTILCGIIKIPIINVIRKYDHVNGVNSKKTADKIRNVCNLLVGILSIIFVAMWYVFTQSFNVFLDIKIYAEMLGSFTCAKVIYMLYEGVGNCSIKKLCHSILDFFHKKIITHKKNASKQTTLTIIQDFFINTIHLPLTEEQLSELNDRIISNERK